MVAGCSSTSSPTAKLWVAAVDRQGERLWKTETGPYHSNHGYGSSPALFGALVIVAGDNKGARIDRLVGSSFLVALHRETGKIVWRIKRAAADNYATPIVAHVAGKPQLLISGNQTVCSYDPATGDELWRCRWPGRQRGLDDGLRRPPCVCLQH